MRSSVYDTRASTVNIDSFDLMEMIKITSNVEEAGPSKTNKIIKALTTAPYTTNTQTHPLGTD